MKQEVYDKIKGALYGVAIGDALGAPLEFMSEEEIQRKHGKVTEMIGGGWLNVKPGEITDDTQMTIAVAKGILDNPEDPVPEIGKHFIEWYNSMPKDVGATCQRAINKAIILGGGYPPKTMARWMKASEDTDKQMNGHTAGNGALMRTIYPALYYKPGNKMMWTTKNIAEMTHMNEESTRCCIQYVQEVCLMLNGYNGVVGIETIDRETGLRKYHNPTGYVIDSYAVASDAVNFTNTFEEALVYAVNKGGDADTIGAIAGGMAGAKYGFSSIPERWVETLEAEVKEQLDYLVDAAMKNRKETE